MKMIPPHPAPPTSEFQLPESTLTKSQKEEIQWDLVQKHHAKGKWREIWTTYNYMGDVIDETIGTRV